MGANQPSQRHHHEDRAACPMLPAEMQALGKLDCWCFCAVIDLCRGVHPPRSANSCTQDSCQPVNPQTWLSPWVCLGPQCVESTLVSCSQPHARERAQPSWPSSVTSHTTRAPELGLAGSRHPRVSMFVPKTPATQRHSSLGFCGCWGAMPQVVVT